MTYLTHWAKGRLLVLSLVLGGIAISQSGCLLAAAGAAGAGAGYVAAKSSEPHETHETVEIHEERSASSNEP